MSVRQPDLKSDFTGFGQQRLISASQTARELCVAKDGGLYLPKRFPPHDDNFWVTQPGPAVAVSGSRKHLALGHEQSVVIYDTAPLTAVAAFQIPLAFSIGLSFDPSGTHLLVAYEFDDNCSTRGGIYVFGLDGQSSSRHTAATSEAESGPLDASAACAAVQDFCTTEWGWSVDEFSLSLANSLCSKFKKAIDEMTRYRQSTQPAKYSAHWPRSSDSKAKDQWWSISRQGGLQVFLPVARDTKDSTLRPQLLNIGDRQVAQALEWSEALDNVVDAIFSPDGRFLFTFDVYGQIASWDTESHEKVGEAYPPFSCDRRIFVCSPCSTWLMVGLQTRKQVLIWDVSNGDLGGRSFKLPETNAHSEYGFLDYTHWLYRQGEPLALCLADQEGVWVYNVSLTKPIQSNRFSPDLIGFWEVRRRGGYTPPYRITGLDAVQSRLAISLSNGATCIYDFTERSRWCIWPEVGNDKPAYWRPAVFLDVAGRSIGRSVKRGLFHRWNLDVMSTSSISQG